MASAVKFCVVVVPLLVTISVHGAPTDGGNDLLQRLKDILAQRQSDSGSSSSSTNEGHSPVDLENDVDRFGRSNYGAKDEAPPFQTDENDRLFSSRGPGLTQDQKNRAVALHNQLRRQEGASNMQVLHWNDRLAQLAQNWADRCVYMHRPPNSYNPKDYGFPTVGENIWAWSDTSQTVPDKAIQMWYAEKQHYVYPSNQCLQQPCGHYTTVTWGPTTDVGCGYAVCGHLGNANYNNGAFMVCNYGPWGAGTQPFKKGSPCTQCDTGSFYCTNNLCDSRCSSPGGNNQCQCKARCKCGSQTQDCKCQCQQGFTGSDCSQPCRDTDPNCGANPGWPAQWCTDKNIFNGMMYDQVNQKCPKMCKHCQPGTQPCRSSRVDNDAERLDDGELSFLIGALQNDGK